MQQRRILTSKSYSFYEGINDSLNRLLKNKQYEPLIKNIKKYCIKSDDLNIVFNPIFNDEEVYKVNKRVYDTLRKLLSINREINVLVIKDFFEETKGYSLSKDQTIFNSSVYMGNVLVGSSSGEYEGDSYHFKDIDHVQLHFTRVKDGNQKDIYGGRKVLFIAVNIKSVDVKDHVKRS